MALIDKDIYKAKSLLEAGEVIGIPTETVYGLAGNAFNVQAVTKIFQTKNRPTFDPLIVHSSSLAKIIQFVETIPPLAQKLATHFWPGPLTLLLQKKPNIPDLVTSGLETVAVRIPSHPLILDLLELLEFPLAAPSANPFGYISPTQAEHVQAQLGNKIPYILDGGPSHVGIESTIIGFEDTTPIVYRLGGLSIEAIESVIGPVSLMPHSSSNPQAPGMLKSHYAPRKPLVLDSVDQVLKQYVPEKIGYMGFSDFRKDLPKKNQLVLSQTRNYAEAAQKLFAAMRMLDTFPHLEIIVAELLPEEDLGRAINDRIRRAAAR
ncbi:L-threonylcarbamoyladenylate synthase [Cytophagaceae bacterium YF14B1]|uniref:Threonylcarbamoyl-AMP synthase n=1 Tax=Xanthocytophaga flava TaxID=3048013 RepID=A0AAE3U7F5_9BACT|nr:L-threonylcarbamoyladenylate synthase [Xanthocytophaga flavus]MDJ1479629.1 L-threonylcarbamoyladenylate synthase [Xanthocytophaga flavus]